ncbi:hypothetical protein BWQ96_06503 [Gracilariopsis chorda]|uniref:Aminoglycoside phosphotransferase domain-containing protein n=1 Tax=Gracilariopsis chorda TaxID=448386 RepID=A0A2V3INV6_9FLOR|nr:hypothetical protein BWQ96_06503 [Gracilariopsis chorda]|eukprot:PXF43771.1 hypothetical protein BWQ96_06503 [Gracilariopsis chorda]
MSDQGEHVKDETRDDDFCRLLIELGKLQVQSLQQIEALKDLGLQVESSQSLIRQTKALLADKVVQERLAIYEEFPNHAEDGLADITLHGTALYELLRELYDSGKCPLTLTHGDITENVLKADDGSLVLFDWGAARIDIALCDTFCFDSPVTDLVMDEYLSLWENYATASDLRKLLEIVPIHGNIVFILQGYEGDERAIFVSIFCLIKFGGSHGYASHTTTRSSCHAFANSRAFALPYLFDDEEDEHEASDGDNHWKIKSKSRSVSCDVGDFISLDTGIGGAPRTAYIEAYLPEAGTHFVSFCDRRGGNLQIKVTPDNHHVPSEAEGKKLAKQKQREVHDEDYDKDNAAAEILSDEAPPPKTRRTPKRQGKLTSSRPAKRSNRYKRTPEIKGKSANQDICGRCISIVWPGENLVYVALILGYSSYSKQHQVVYMLDHCIETLSLKYREWTPLPREKELWMDNSLVGKRLYVFWPGEYDDEGSQVLAQKAFGDETKVPYEAYVLSYLVEQEHKTIYPATEDMEISECSGLPIVKAPQLWKKNGICWTTV